MTKSRSKKGGAASKDDSKGLFLDAQPIHDVLTFQFSGFIDPASSVYLAGVLQCIAAEIIEAASKNKMKSSGSGSAITEQDFQNAIENDAELKKLFDEM